MLQTPLARFESAAITTIIVDLIGLLSSISRWSQCSSEFSLFLFQLVLLGLLTTGIGTITFSL